MKPLISYYGGSQRNSSKIVDLIQDIPHTVYAECFCGGAAVLFAKPKKIGLSDDYREVLNDSNSLIYNLYKVAIDDPHELARKLSLVPYSQQFHRESKKICKNPSQFSPLDLAVATVIQCRQSFAKKMLGGWGFALASQNGARSWARFQQQLEKIIGRLSGVYLDNLDAIDFIKRWDSPQTLFYCDPPFVGTEQGHYSGYTEDDYTRLLECLDNSMSSYVLENFQQEIEPKTYDKKIPIDYMISAKKTTAGRLSTGKRDAPDRQLVWYVRNRSHMAREDLARKLRHNQLQLF